MDNKLEDINRIFANRVSPFQSILNASGKNQVIEQFKYQLWQIWTMPILLTYGELICFKHERLRAANSIALFKFASIPVGVALSLHFYSKLQHKINYYDALYPHAPKSQIELTKDIQMAKQLHK